MIISWIVTKFLNLLYGPLAILYDFVSWCVSFGQWKNWVYTVIPFIHGNKVLELGSGPGHLLGRLRSEDRQVYGVDSSRKMVNLSLNRLYRKGILFENPGNPMLTCALASHLPFPVQYFDTILATFPTAYIFDKLVLKEIRRTLKPDGKFLVLLSAHPRRDSFCSFLLGLLYQLTGEESQNRNSIEKFVYTCFQISGFSPTFTWITANYSDLFLING